MFGKKESLILKVKCYNSTESLLWQFQIRITPSRGKRSLLSLYSTKKMILLFLGWMQYIRMNTNISFLIEVLLIKIFLVFFFLDFENDR